MANELTDDNSEQARVRLVHSLVLERLYHEDLLLTQRTYNFLTFNVFLGALLALSSAAAPQTAPGSWYLIPVLGTIVSFLQVAFGRRIDRAIAFWREYAKLLEIVSDLPVDHVLFDFYKHAQATTPWGNIGSAGKNDRPMFKTFPWNAMPSTNVMIGVLLPWLIATLWIIALVTALYRVGYWPIVILTLTAYAILTVTTWRWPLPAVPKAQIAKGSLP